MGDFVLPFINKTSSQTQAPRFTFIDLIYTNYLLQHFSIPTKQKNILDHVIMTPDLRTIGLEVMDNIDDHHMIDFKHQINDPNARTQPKNILSYTLANFELMNEEFGSFDYEVLMRNTNDGECYMILKKTAAVTEQQIQAKSMRPTDNPPLFSQKISTYLPSPSYLKHSVKMKLKSSKHNPKNYNKYIQ
ncbi:hypothetical protein FHG87_024786 [Trinorchestia longiramus]|nr:hypothetical protein FHG87_024786 [Trinorchestia longiramus]